MGTKRFAAILMATVWGQGQLVLAVDYSWVAAVGGDFQVAENWDPFSPPGMIGPGGASDTVNFDIGTAPTSRYKVTNVSGENLQLLVHSDSLQLEVGDYSLLGAIGSSVAVGVDDGDTGDLILNGTDGSILQNEATAIGAAAGSTGVVAVNNLEWNSDGDLVVGDAGTGTLTIAAGSAVSSTGGYIGDAAGSSGAVTVTGAGSSWTMNPFSEFIIGDDGAGTLTIEDGGSVSSDFSYISEQNGSTGAVTVTGTGSNWNIVGDLEVGGAISGMLTVSDGGDIVNGDRSAYIGSDSGATGTVTVTGAGSTWTGIGELIVGESGDGAVTIANGGSVAGRVGLIASGASASGTVQITGADSSWVVDESLYVGGFGSGVGGSGVVAVADNATLRVTDTAKVWSSGQINVDGGAMIVGAGSPVAIPNHLFITAGGVVDLSDGGEIIVGSSGGVNPGVLRISDGATLVYSFGNFVGTRINVVGELVGIGGIEGELRNNGAVRSMGILLVNGDYVETADALLSIEIGGLMPQTDFDVLELSGTATLRGTLDVLLVDDFVPALGDTFEFLSADTEVRGSFGTELLPLLARGLAWDVIYNANSVVLQVIEGLAGDYNDNGVVDAADYTVWRDALGDSGPNLAADGNANGEIDAGDYTVWKSHFGQTVASGSGATRGLTGSIGSLAVPEPRTLGLSLLWLCTSSILVRGRKHQWL